MTQSRPARQPAPALRWRWTPFDALTLAELYAALRLRSQVFVVEQNCVYLDLDDADQLAHHLLGWSDAVATANAPPRTSHAATSGVSDAPILAAYARVFPPGVKFAEASIGRVITDPRFRRGGYGKLLMRESLQRVAELAPGSPVRIGAQAHLEPFYGEFGFRRVSDIYDEDGIPHIEMLRPA